MTEAKYGCVTVGELEQSGVFSAYAAVLGSRYLPGHGESLNL